MRTWVYRPPPRSAYIYRARYSRGPIITANLLPVPSFRQFAVWEEKPAPANFTFLNLTVSHGPGPPSPYFRTPFGGRPVTYFWDFGDGTAVLEQTVQPDGSPFGADHNYPNPGTYTVKLTACNSVGCAVLERVGYVVVSQTRGVNIKRLSDHDLLSFNLTLSENVRYYRVSAGERVSISGIDSPVSEPRRLDDDPKLGVNLDS